MKKQLSIYLFLFLLLILASCSPNAKDILKGAYDKCQSINNGYYEMEKYLKLMSGEDTIQIFQSSFFNKLNDGSTLPFVFNSHLSSPAIGMMNLLYNGEFFVTYTDKGQLVLPKKGRMEDIWKLYGKNPGFSPYLPIVFEDSRPIPDSSMLTSDKVSIRFVKEEKINDVLCYHIKVVASPEYDHSVLKEYIIQTEYNYWIKKQDSIPIQFTISRDLKIRNDTLTEFEKYILTKYELNNLSDEVLLALASIPPNINVNKQAHLINKEPLKIGSIAPSWSLISTKGDSLSLSDLKGNLILLDFFYTSCPPCIASIPNLQDLSEKYKIKGLHVIGVSPIDSGITLKNFTEKHSIDYTILSGNQDLANRYNIYAYPTTYLIDKDGNILFQHVGGYQNPTIVKLENIIQQNTNN